MCPQKIALLTDSCADLSPALAAENHIHIVPLRILCADGEYSDGLDIRGGSGRENCLRHLCRRARTLKRFCGRS